MNSKTYIRPMSVKEVEDDLDDLFGELSTSSKDPSYIESKEFKALRGKSVYEEIEMKVKFYQQRIDGLLAIKDSLPTNIEIGEAYRTKDKGPVIVKKFFVNPKTKEVLASCVGASHYGEVKGTELLPYDGSGSLLFKK